MTAGAVGLNAMFLVPGVVGGSEEYTVRILSAFADHAQGKFDAVLFARTSFARAYPELCARLDTAAIELPRNRVLRVGAESTWLARQARRRGVALMHHLGGRIPAVSRPSIVTVHDLQPLEYPERFGAAKRRYLAYALPRSARRARRIIGVSEFTRRAVIDRLGVAPDRVEAISAPCRQEPLAPHEVDDGLAQLDGELRRLVEQGEPYFVYPAITHAHKNHLMLLDAFAAVDRDARLVLPGGAGALDDRVRERSGRPDLSHRVLRRPRMARNPLDVLIAHATALVFPSEYEGFGLPVAEAMRLGCPVLAADAAALPEAVGGAGTLIPAHATSEWTAAMVAALAWSRTERDEWRARGRARIAALAPEAIAARWAGVHLQALS